ncbi:MAG: DUF4388 domain-containing protein [Thermoanaerobaculaceae bacterium]
MALEGTLRDFSLSDIFQLIGLQRKTGVLTLRSPEDVVTVSFLDGKVVGADSLNKRLEDRLGQVLLKTATVTKDELDSALKKQMETLERLGHILIESAVVSRDELKRAFEQQILQIIFRVFRWQDGDYHFSQETSVDYDAELVTPLGSESILMEGARMLDEWPIIEKRIPYRGVVFIPTPASRQAEVNLDHEPDDLETFNIDLEPAFPEPESSGRVLISPIERDILALTDGVNAVDDIVRKSPHGEFETCKALYTLLTRSLIRQASRDEITRASQRASTETLTAPSWQLHFPWLALLLAPLFVFTVLLAPRNPADPLLGPGPKLPPRLLAAASFARMNGLWHILQSRALLVGSYPDNLAELYRERFLPTSSILDPWGRPYRYVLREQSVLLAGNNSAGVPDSNLMLSQHLGMEGEEVGTGPGAVILTP